MKNHRQTEFAKIEGMFIRFQVPQTDKVWDILKNLEASKANMTAEQIALIGSLFERIVSVRNKISKQKMIDAINRVKL